ncbi:prolyl oligopeptidase family serine peptidase [Paenibacillus sp. GCM10027628]|uniref:carboxylesterase family protein n=1 Tax=Paenibacillus sp. GCM10027628 TaxID=3273413 RepID=UPI00363D6764
MIRIDEKLRKDGASLNYLLHLPDRIESSQPLPLLLYLHGVSQRGNDLDLLRLDFLPQQLEKKSDIPFIVVTPQCPNQSSWNMETDSIIALLDEIVAEYPVDHKRIYLTGISMGGYGVWDLAIKYPQRFAALAPMCGGGEPDKAEVLKNIPIWAFHGEKDDVIPLQETLNMVEAVKRHKGNVKLTIYPNAGHDLSETYADPLLYNWLLEQVSH